MAESQPTSVVETWKPVVGFEGLYNVSDQGRVCSLERICSNGRGAVRKHGGRIMCSIAERPRVKLCRNGQVFRKAVAHLVLEAFVGPKPGGRECCHANDNPRDNRLANLRWASRKDNEADKRRNGNTAQGERHGMSKLSKRNVRCIDRALKRGERGVSIAKRFKVIPATVSAIKHRRLWAWLFGEERKP